MENKKSFWQKPEGKTGFLFIAGALVGGGWLLYKMLPKLITLLENTLYAGLLAGALVGIVYLLLDPKFRASMWYLYKMAMRWFTGWIITLDPIAILKSYISDLQAKKQKMEAQLVELKGQLGSLKKKIDEKMEELEEQARLAKIAASKPGREGEAKVYRTQVARLENHIKKLKNLVDRMEVLYKVLERMHYYSGIMILNTKNEVDMREDEYKTIKKSHSIMKSAMSIINGEGDKKLMFDEAMEYVVEDIGFKIGEMDRMLDASAQFINSVDLHDEVFAEQGLKFLEELDQKGIDNIFGDRQEQKSITQGTPKSTINFSVVSEVPVSQQKGSENKDYKKFFN